MNIEEDDILQARLAEIELLGDEERAIALEELTRDYPGLAKQLSADRGFAEEMMMTEMPGMNEGPAGNQFAVQTAANPLEHMAAAGSRIMGARDRKAATDALRQNSADMGSQNTAMMNSQVSSPMANALRWEEDKKKGYRGILG